MIVNIQPQRDKIRVRIHDAICDLDADKKLCDYERESGRHYSYEFKISLAAYCSIYLDTKDKTLPKVWIVLPLDKNELIFIKNHKIANETNTKHQYFKYDGACSSIELIDESNFDEIIKALEEAYKQQNK